MTTLPHDDRRCHGALLPLSGMFAAFERPHSQCRDCLRRTAPRDDNRLYSYIQPPEFTDTCPKRIAP